MINLIKTSLSKVFSNIIINFILFVISMLAAGFIVNSIGVLAIPIDRALPLGVKSNTKGSNNSEVGMIFLLKKFGGSTSRSNVSLEINEISEPKIFSGIGSVPPTKNINTVLNKRYVRIEGVNLPNNARADYAVIGKSAGGKISGSVLIGQEKVTDCVFMTNFQFYILCFCFFIFGGVVVGFASYYQAVSKEKVSKKSGLRMPVE